MESQDDPRALEEEVEAYRTLAGEAGIPRVYWFGKEGDYNALVFELLGPSLEDLFNYCGRRFSLKTILLIADQAITRIERIHRRFLHRDIKPDNFTLGIGRQGNILYTIDFGLAKEFSDDEQYKGYQGLPLGGTISYASVNDHKGLGRHPDNLFAAALLLTELIEQSWGDDLESLGYMFVYFARGSLPWGGIKATTDLEERELVKNMKINISGEELCQDFLPTEFSRYIDYTRSLRFGEKPNYAYLRKIFRDRFRSEGYKYDNIFDWTIKRFNEIHGRADLVRQL